MILIISVSAQEELEQCVQERNYKRETQNQRDSLTAPVACSLLRLPALIDVILTSEVHVHSPANLRSNLCPPLVRPAASCCSRNFISFSNSAGSSGTLIPFSKSKKAMRRGVH